MKKEDLRTIPPAELEALAVLWRLGRSTVREVMEALEEDGRRLAYTTVLTLLTRLERRGCVRSDRDGAAHVYRPSVEREDVFSARLGSLKTLAGGEPVPLILKFVEAQHLSSSDLRRLREHLSRLEGESGKREKR